MDVELTKDQQEVLLFVDQNCLNGFYQNMKDDCPVDGCLDSVLYVLVTRGLLEKRSLFGTKNEPYNCQFMYWLTNFGKEAIEWI